MAQLLVGWAAPKLKLLEWVTLDCMTVSGPRLYTIQTSDSPLIEREALRWVQKYISAFNGDPHQVTM